MPYRSIGLGSCGLHTQPILCRFKAPRGVSGTQCIAPGAELICVASLPLALQLKPRARWEVTKAHIRVAFLAMHG